MGNRTDPAARRTCREAARAADRPPQRPILASNGVYNLRRRMGNEVSRKCGVSSTQHGGIATIGSREGFSPMLLALMGKGDTAVVADPAFQITLRRGSPAATSSASPLGNTGVLDRIRKSVDRSTPKPKVVILKYPSTVTHQAHDCRLGCLHEK